MGLRKRKMRAIQRTTIQSRLPPRCTIEIKEHGAPVLEFKGNLRQGLKEFASMCLDVYGIEIPEAGITPRRDIKKEELEYLEAKKKCENQPAKEE
jgi:hypothetical protein